jgi:hypothetical protein
MRGESVLRFLCGVCASACVDFCSSASLADMVDADADADVNVWSDCGDDGDCRLLFLVSDDEEGPGWEEEARSPKISIALTVAGELIKMSDAAAFGFIRIGPSFL